MDPSGDIALIGDKPKFYQTFINFLNEKFKTEDTISTTFKDPTFRSSLVSKNLDARTIVEIAPYLAPLVRKPQELAVDLDDLYVAEDCCTMTHYMCSSVPMIDFDAYRTKDGNEIRIEDILPHCRCQINGVIEQWGLAENSNIEESRNCKWKSFECSKKDRDCVYRYRIYKSRGGYHAFLISHKLDNRSNEALQLMIEAQTDYFYIVFTYLRGWCVRLNKKKVEDPNPNVPIYSYVGDVICGELVKRENKKVAVVKEYANILDFHMELCEMAKDFPPVL